MFQHTPDNEIIINGYLFPLDWWLTQEPNYSGLPTEIIGRLYVPRKRHHLTKLRASDEALIQMDGGYDTEDFLWLEGDGYIAKLQTYIKEYQLYINPPLTQEEIQQVERDQQETIAKEELRIKREDAIEEGLMSGTGPKAKAYQQAKQ